MGFVVMREHVHALLHFNDRGRIGTFVNQWERRSLIALEDPVRGAVTELRGRIDLNGPIRQPGYYVFNVYSEAKAGEKLDYMHNNPVKARLVNEPAD